MLVYNITIKVEHEIVQDWLTWKLNVHIPEVMTTKLFTGYKIFKLLSQDDSDGLTFVVQYFLNSLEDYHQYLSDFFPLMNKKIFDTWKNHLFIFSSLMEAVQ